jgi:hypothetical protein
MPPSLRGTGTLGPSLVWCLRRFTALLLPVIMSGFGESLGESGRARWPPRAPPAAIPSHNNHIWEKANKDRRDGRCGGKEGVVLSVHGHRSHPIPEFRATNASHRAPVHWSPEAPHPLILQASALQLIVTIGHTPFYSHRPMTHRTNPTNIHPNNPKKKTPSSSDLPPCACSVARSFTCSLESHEPMSPGNGVPFPCSLGRRCHCHRQR